MPLGHDGANVNIIFSGYVTVGPIEAPAEDAPESAAFRIIPNPTIELSAGSGGSR
jgi:hypothetical protein